MNEIRIFEGHEVEVFELNGTVLFNPYHVGKCLELSGEAVRKAMSRMNEKQVIKVKNSDVTNSNFRKLNNAGENFLTEGGVYKLVFKSRKPNAEAFTDWVTDEVLPSVRKDGIYATDHVIDNILNDPDFGIQLLTKLKEERAARTAAEKKIISLNTENDLLAQKALEWADRPLINALVRAYAHSIDDDFKAAWTDFKKELLYRHSINLNSRITAYLNHTEKKTRPKTLDMLDDSEIPQALSTAVALCKDNDIDISNILSKRQNNENRD